MGLQHLEKVWSWNQVALVLRLFWEFWRTELKWQCNIYYRFINLFHESKIVFIRAGLHRLWKAFLFQPTILAMFCCVFQPSYFVLQCWSPTSLLKVLAKPPVSILFHVIYQVRGYATCAQVAYPSGRQGPMGPSRPLGYQYQYHYDHHFRGIYSGKSDCLVFPKN